MAASLYSGLLPRMLSPAEASVVPPSSLGPTPPFAIYTDSVAGAQTNIEYRVPSGNTLLAGAVTTTEGASSRFMFNPLTGSVRAGTTSGTQWNAANRGANSAAFGADTQASGTASFSAGSSNVASGAQSVALGASANATSAHDFVWSDGSPTTSSGATTFNVGAAGGVNMWTNAGRTVLTAVSPSVPGITTSGAAASFGSSDATNVVLKSGGSTVATMTPALATTFSGAVVGNTSVTAKNSLVAGFPGVATGSLQMNGFITGGTLTVSANPATTTYSVFWPISQGAATTVLTNNGSGTLTWATPAANGAFVQSGNSFGTTATLGTNDSNSLVLRTNSTTAATIDTSQNLTVVGSVRTGTAGGTTGTILYNGSTSGTLTVNVPASITSYAVTWPAAQGAASSILTNNGAGVLSWAAAATNTFIQGGNSFGSTAILGTNDTFGLQLRTNGAAALSINSGGNVFAINQLTSFGQFNVGAVAGTTGTIVYNGSTAGILTTSVPASFSNYSLVWPSAQGAATTVLTNNGSGTLSWTTPAANGAFVQGGNSFGTDAILGTNDAKGVSIQTGGVPALTVNAGGDTRANFQLTSGGQFNVGTVAGTTGTIVYNGSTAGILTTSVPASFTNYSLVWPSAQGAATTVLTNNGSGTLSWATPAANGGFIQGGNSFGATGTLGTNDSNSLVLRTNSTTAITVSTAQVATFATGATFTNATASYVPATLNYYESQQSVSVSFTGAASFSASVVFTRIGGWVYVRMPPVVAASTGAVTTITSAAGAIPTRFRPMADTTCSFQVATNSITPVTSGLCVFFTDGTITAFVDSSGSTLWSAIGSNGFNRAFSTSWPV